MSAAEPNPYILVVEDNPLVATLLQQVLSAEGYEAGVVGDGLDALDRVARRRPDLIFLDLDLPGLNGYEVCRRLKGDPATRLVPVALLTAQCERRNKVDPWAHGADDFLTKPFQLVEVTARCRSLL